MKKIKNKKKTIFIVIAIIIAIMVCCLICNKNLIKDSLFNRKTDNKEDRYLYSCNNNYEYYLLKKPKYGDCEKTDILTNNWKSITPNLIDRDYLFYIDKDGYGNLYDVTNKKILFTTNRESTGAIQTVYNSQHKLTGIAYIEYEGRDRTDYYYSLNSNKSTELKYALCSFSATDVNGIIIADGDGDCIGDTGKVLYNIEKDELILDEDHCASLERNNYDNYICKDYGYKIENARALYNEMYDSNGKLLVSFEDGSFVFDNISPNYIIFEKVVNNAFYLYVTDYNQKVYGTINLHELIKAFRNELSKVTSTSLTIQERKRTIEAMDNYYIAYEILQNIEGFTAAERIVSGRELNKSYYDESKYYLQAVGIGEEDLNDIEFSYSDSESDLYVELVFKLDEASKEYKYFEVERLDY